MVEVEDEDEGRDASRGGSRKIELLAERPRLAHVLRGERVRRPLDLPSDLSELGARSSTWCSVQEGATRCKISLTTTTPY